MLCRADFGDSGKKQRADFKNPRSWSSEGVRSSDLNELQVRLYRCVCAPLFGKKSSEGGGDIPWMILFSQIMITPERIRF